MYSQQKDLVLIRHAESTFNQNTLKVIQENNLGAINWLDFIKVPEYNKLVTYNAEYFDAKLSEAGINQAKKLNQKVKSLQKFNENQSFNILDVDVIIVSPSLRAMETCRLVFEGCQAPVFVQPYASQVFRYSCDVPSDINQKIQNYPNYNFSKLQKFGNDYYLAIFPESEQQRIKAIFQSENAITLQLKQELLLKMLREGTLVEHPQWMRERASKFKDLLLEYKKKYNKIAVVAHNYTLEFLRCRQFTQTGDLAYPTGIYNCYPYYHNLDELCSYR